MLPVHPTRSPTEDRMNTGIKEEHRTAIAEGLSHLLADTYSLYLKSHNFHWNVTGPMFRELHLMFEEHYTELAMAVDEIAERIRALGAPAPGSFSQFAKLSSVPEADGVPAALDMVKELADGHETVARNARALMTTASEAHDSATEGVLSERIVVHEKTAWMLRATIAK
ncbi:MAG: Dps family protein [Planctomycetota bacterium]